MNLYALYEDGNPLEDEQHFATVQADGDVIYNTPPYSGSNQIENWDYTGGGTGVLKDGKQTNGPNCQNPGQTYNDFRTRWGAAVSYVVGSDTYTRTFMKARINLAQSQESIGFKLGQWFVCNGYAHCGTDYGFFQTESASNWINLDASPHLGQTYITFYRSFQNG